MRVLVTGGTGFIGAWSAKAVVDAGHHVRFLVRNPARLESSAAKLGLDTSDHVVGDITDPDSVRRALDGCDAVVHAAAVVAVDPRRAEEMKQTNLAGARNVLGTAIELGCDPVVYVSSIAALFQPGVDLLTPDLPVCGPSDAYGQSKARVEEYARDLQTGGAPIAITYPGMVIGPPAGDQFGEAVQGVEAAVRLRFLPGRSAAWTMVDVREVAAAHAALLEPGHGPRRFMLGGPRLPISAVADMLASVTGRRMGILPVPDSALRLVGRLVDVVDRFVPFDTPVSEAAMEYYTRMPDTDDRPSEVELGVEYRDSEETLADTVAGLMGAGRL